MDKQKAALIGAIVVVCCAMVCGTIFGVRGIAVPGWLSAILGVIVTPLGIFLAWVAKSPADAKAEAPKGDA